ncbi:MAG TPA: DUF501 domain-containing protein, partial [Actinomycetota bacterium]|nr:DUF501 domain-containing protein [Actinomycetota bacterium]
MGTRCHLGIPMVIESHPVLDDGSPFPTLYWLTCPVLSKSVSTLESDGWMAGVNSRLASDGSLRARVAGAIDRYRARRDARAEISDGGSATGGGPDRVKCV